MLLEPVRVAESLADARCDTAVAKACRRLVQWRRATRHHTGPKTDVTLCVCDCTELCMHHWPFLSHSIGI